MLRGQLLGLTGTGCIIGTESAASSGGEAPVLLTADVVVFATGYQDAKTGERHQVAADWEILGAWAEEFERVFGPLRWIWEKPGA